MAIAGRLLGVPEVAGEIARQLERDLPTVLTAFATEALIDIRPMWPVKSGKSRDSLRVDVTGTDVAIVCDVDYAKYIHQKGEVGPTYFTRIIGYIQLHLPELGARTVKRLGMGQQ